MFFRRLTGKTRENLKRMSTLVKTTTLQGNKYNLTCLKSLVKYTYQQAVRALQFIISDTIFHYSILQQQLRSLVFGLFSISSDESWGSFSLGTRCITVLLPGGKFRAMKVTFS